MSRILESLSNLKLKTRNIDDYCLIAHKKSNHNKMQIIISNFIKRLHSMSSVMIDDKDFQYLLSSDFIYDIDKNLYISNIYNIKLSKKEFNELKLKLRDYIDYYNKIVNGD